jgi:cell division control protein 6
VEREAVRAFAESFLHDDDDSKTTTLYISGSPGTGKTALVNSVLRPYSNDTKLRIISINCMALNSLDELWDRIVEELVPGGLSKNKGRGAKKVKGKEAVLKALAEMEDAGRW